jgi:uncharacterized integral membrane protein
MSAKRQRWFVAVLLIVSLLLAGQATSGIDFSGGLDLPLGLILWLIDGVLLWFSVRIFRQRALVAAVAKVRVENPGTLRDR